jgi:hypothetical protein
MPKQTDLEKLVWTCLHDAKFCKLLEKNPKAALESLDMWSKHREKVVREKLAGAYPALQSLAGAFGRGKSFN